MKNDIKISSKFVKKVIMSETEFQSNTKLAGIIRQLESLNLDACIIPNSDPHLSEYVAEHWRGLTWISGFTGSAGNLTITPMEAGLWTDSRYFIQAVDELNGSGIKLQKLRIPHTPEYIEWLLENVREGGSIGIDEKLFSTGMIRRMEKIFINKNIKLIDCGDLLKDIWADRPSLPTGQIFEHDVTWAGQSRSEKMENIRQRMRQLGATHHLLSALDDIAWTFNIRGNDVAYNPVAIAYALISYKEVTLFIDDNKISEDLKFKFKSEGIQLESYRSIAGKLMSLSSEDLILLNSNKTNSWLYKSIPEACTIIDHTTIPTLLKTVKNETEINHIREVMINDGVAMTRFFKWLEENIEKKPITEVSASDQLRDFRAMNEHFVGESFPSIAGYKGNGAIVHYRPEEGKCKTLAAEGIFLLDSGGQYLNGTTDITRTVAMGTPTAEQKRDNTLVLKGHIALATARYPKGTKGYQLEILARKALWDAGFNYGHGTGHGVGFFLNVHEGPQSISTGASSYYNAPLEPGMLTSNEPGIYRADQWGIRIENLVLTVEGGKTEFGTFLKFETVTLCHLDTNLIEKSLLTEAEIDWVNAYHKEVYEKLSPRLTKEEARWLSDKTKSI